MTRWTRITGGTRIELDGSPLDFDFAEGKITLGGREFDATQVPMLVVIDDEGHIDIAEELDPELIGPDTVSP
ncbi:MAG: hypothetical protein HKN23_13495 [Verrucomicrobiales bacterium]|nr:hypothetical protein [Verrucomicrobiales bacterium]